MTRGNMRELWRRPSIPGPMSKIILKELHWIVEEKHKVDACQQHGLPLSQVRLTVEEAVLKYGRVNERASIAL
jgi:hypothetical protein